MMPATQTTMAGLYIHIPFCARRCSYCDFFFTTNTRLAADFLDSLEKEIRLRSSEFGNLKFDTIFFGGGTPSLLSGDQISLIIRNINERFDVSSDSEISLEANPEDLTAIKLEELRRAGINRLSIGVQSFVDSELQFLTRHHTSSEAREAVKNSVSLFGNVSIDLIYSLPSQNAEHIIISIDQARELGVKHISAYTLTFEERTLLTKSANKGEIIRNTPEQEALLYEAVVEEITSGGFSQYEVSNFALPGYESRHNRKYWQLEPYLGLGPSAHSFTGNRRWNNVNSVGRYCDLLNSNFLPDENENILTEEQLHSDFIMLALRAGGIDFAVYRKKFRRSFEDDNRGIISVLVQNGLATVSENTFCLTAKGYAIADEIIARFF